jgi:[acyl-carrier-protein] S-malonyltransferase
VACVEYLAGAGVSAVIEFGPGRVLTGLVKRISPGVELTNVNGMAAIGR